MSVNNITAEANYAYPPLAPITLGGSASYWLVGLPTTAVGEDDYRWQLLNSAFDTGALGWSIGDVNWFSNGQGVTWNADNQIRPGMFSIEATQVAAAAIPELASGIVWMALIGIGTFWSGSRSRVHRHS
jgi:hypothetical protein